MTVEAALDELVRRWWDIAAKLPPDVVAAAESALDKMPDDPAAAVVAASDVITVIGEHLDRPIRSSWPRGRNRPGARPPAISRS